MEGILGANEAGLLDVQYESYDSAFFSSPIEKLEGGTSEANRLQTEKDRPISCSVYYDGESISGQVGCLRQLSCLC